MGKYEDETSPSIVCRLRIQGEIARNLYKFYVKARHGVHTA